MEDNKTTVTQVNEGQGTPQTNERMFTQDEVNRIVQDRLARVKVANEPDQRELDLQSRELALYARERIEENGLDKTLADELKGMDKATIDSGRVLLVTPAIYQLMKQSKEIILSTNVGEDMRLKGVISNLDGMNVIKVSSARVPENFGFMVVHPCATVAPTKLADYKIHQDPPGISGTLIEGRIVYDAFVLNNKKKAIYYQENKTV